MISATLHEPPAVVAYQATVVKVIDGDTLKVRVAGFPAPFDPIDVRVWGIDTPEHRRPPAQAQCEVALGVKAAEFAQALIKPGVKVTVTYRLGVNDKYGRLLGSVTLSDGRDYGGLLIAKHLARPYGADGNLHKTAWCAD